MGGRLEWTYDLGQPAAGQEKLKVHAGLVRGAKQVSDIKPLNVSENLVSFNCFMDIEGAEGGALVPAYGQVGYIITRSPTATEPPNALVAATYAEIFCARVRPAVRWMRW